MSVDLVQRAQNGDTEALNRLFRRYYARIRRLVRLRLMMSPQLRRKYDSVDVVQETLVVAIERFDRFEVRDEASLINWLAKIAVNVIRTKRKKASVWQERAMDSVRLAVESGEIQIPGKDRLPPEIAAEHERWQIFEECLGKLSADHREVILARHFMAPPGARVVPWEVVAREIGAPSAEAARMLHSRARSALSGLLRQRKVD